MQTLKDFTIWSDPDKKEFYKFTTLTSDNPYLEKDSGNQGFKLINKGTINRENRSASLEFIRPFRTFSLASEPTIPSLSPSRPMRLWLQWGVFDGPLDDRQERVKGMRTYI